MLPLLVVPFILQGCIHLLFSNIYKGSKILSHYTFVYLLLLFFIKQKIDLLEKISFFLFTDQKSYILLLLRFIQLRLNFSHGSKKWHGKHFTALLPTSKFHSRFLQHLQQDFSTKFIIWKRLVLDCQVKFLPLLQFSLSDNINFAKLHCYPIYVILIIFFLIFISVLRPAYRWKLMFADCKENSLSISGIVYRQIDI